MTEHYPLRPGTNIGRRGRLRSQWTWTIINLQSQIQRLPYIAKLAICDHAIRVVSNTRIIGELFLTIDPCEDDALLNADFVFPSWNDEVVQRLKAIFLTLNAVEPRQPIAVGAVLRTNEQLGTLDEILAVSFIFPPCSAKMKPYFLMSLRRSAAVLDSIALRKSV